MKKFFKVLLIVLIAFVLGVCIIVPCVWMGEIKTISSLEQVDPENEYLYCMEYKADYDLDDLIAANIDKNDVLKDYVINRVAKGLPINIGGDEEMENKSIGCTSFQVKNAEGEGFLYGRNYDFYKNPSLVTISHPKNGYASIGVSDMSHFGYGIDNLPNSFTEKLLCLASIYAPVDGVNEKGLCTSIMALPNQMSQQNTGKNVVGTSVIMRLFLDRCATVQEALDLLSTVDVRHDIDGGYGYHYMVADANGDCAIIEFDKNDEWKTMIIRKDADTTCMHITNHLLSEKYLTTIPNDSVGNVQSLSWWRYDTVADYLTQRNGTLTLKEAQDCLSMVMWRDMVWDDGTYEDTQYSNVYNQTTKTLYLRSWFDKYEKTYTFELD